MIAIGDQERQKISAAIQKYFPGSRVMAFGSRVRGDFKRYSDLDICIDSGKILPLGRLAQLEEEFSQSDLLYKVDLVDWHRITPEFQKIIESTSETL